MLPIICVALFIPKPIEDYSIMLYHIIVVYITEVIRYGV